MPKAKTVCIARLGAIGDIAQITPIYRLYKEQGYRVVAYVNPGSASEVLRHNPHIDEIRIHDNSMPTADAFDYMDTELPKQYDKCINLSGVVENNLLPAWYDPHFKWTKSDRHAKCNVNYMDAQLKKAGIKERGLNGEIYLSYWERQWAKKFIQKHAKGKFFILWALSGSSHHKSWAYAQAAADAFLESYPDVIICLVGGDVEKLLEWEHPRVLQMCGELGIRKSIALTRYADVVVGPETGIMNIASCFDTPKVLMLSHSSEENLSKYWTNCVTILPKDTECYPCHKLHHSKSTCNLTGEGHWPLCCMNVRPADVLNAIDDVYKAWRG